MATTAAPMVAILAGGESRRMGRDKGRIVVDGEPLIERTLRLVRSVGCEAMVIGRTKPTEGPGGATRFVMDRQPGLGPLGGLVTALDEVSQQGGDATILLPCDLPKLTAALLRHLVEHLPGASARNGTALFHDNRIEPLASLYRTTILDDNPDLVAKENRSLRHLIEQGDFGRLDLLGAHVDALHNANRPEDLADR